MTSKPNFSIVIPNFNGAQFLGDCLNSLAVAIKNCPASKFEIILVDNGSTDNSISLAKKINSSLKIDNWNLKIIPLQRNHGFAGGVNPGIIRSKYPWVVLVNNDLTLSPDWFAIILKRFSAVTAKTAAIYGLVLTKDGRFIESEGLDFDYSGKCNNIHNGQKFVIRNSKLLIPQNIWGAPASLIIYRKSMLHTIGNFDTDFFAYEEDVDVALRLFKLGYQTLYLPSAVSYHLGSGTSRKMGNFRHRMDFKNWIYLIIKNFSATEIRQNFWGIVEQRLRNLSGLIKSTVRQDGLKSVYTLPKDIFFLFREIIQTLPKMLVKRRLFFKLLQSSS